MLGDSDGQYVNGGWLIHNDQHGAFGTTILLDGDEFGFVVG